MGLITLPARFLASSYDYEVVALSIIVAIFASYVALDLARRVHCQERRLAVVWVAGGAVVMGSGIWSMHFIGMLAMSLPIEVRYAPVTTGISWLAAVAVSAVALGIAGRSKLTRATLLGGAATMGAGICAMHYTGMAAVQIEPGIVWDPRWVALSALIACGASAVALMIFFGVRRLVGWRARLAQAAAALVMGLAISGMHYSGMAAAGFPGDAMCISSAGLGGRHLGAMILVAVVVLLSTALLTTALDDKLQARSLANAELQRIAFFDVLTGVPNRALFDDRLRQAVARVERGSDRKALDGTSKLALIFVDLDGFKPVNDRLGHAAGDNVLRQVADRLRMVLRATDTLARLGGDEFVLLIENVYDVTDATVTAERIKHTMSKPFVVGEREVTLGASMGIVVFPDHASSERLVACADAAMYVAKRIGGSTYVIFEPHMLEGASAQLEMQQDLREALARGELQLHYQPKVDARTGQVRSVEALMRWNHPRLGLVPPSTFIPLAERFGLIAGLGGWVIDEACRQLAAWADAGRRMRVSINLSAQQLKQPDIAARVGLALARHNLDPDQLVCEVAESAAMENAQTTGRVLEELGALGIELSIDDFGTCYSSLSKLRGMRAGELKIDRQFVADVARDADTQAIVDAIVRLGHALGMRVVAEGVETDQQRDVLCALGCDEMQGYLFSRALPGDALLVDHVHSTDGGTSVAFSPSVMLDTVS
jgi:diguanylate cyclase (GGDEF)-like protein